MWGILVIFASYLLSQAASDELKVECKEFYDFPPPSSRDPPSVLADLRVELVRVGENDMLNITWAINIDGSIASLNGTRIEISGEPSYHCEYKPRLAEANLTESQQKWFYHLVEATYGFIVIQAANLPLPPLGSGLSYKVTTIEIIQPSVSTEAPEFTTAAEVILDPTGSDKILGSNAAGSLGFQNVHSPPTVQVPVLLVYPAGNSAFQRAVVALAEFLQWHGGCSMTIDMWQQGKIAELGPMRWLAEQVKAADRVLIVSPERETSSSQPGHCPPNHSLLEPSIPAATQDLYPLILNMVASLAKSTSELSKFWVVHLGPQREKKSCAVLPPEVRACKSFYLMKDLKKLSTSLHAQGKNGKRVEDLIFKPRIIYSKKSTEKLKEAVEKLKGHQKIISTSMPPLKSVLNTV